MFQIFMIIGWAVLFIILLYLWADVRRIAEMVKDSKRELIRSSFGGRSSGKDKDFRQEMQQQEAQQQEAQQQEMQKEVQNREEEAAQSREGSVSVLKESEEKVLQEVLTEFLG